MTLRPLLTPTQVLLSKVTAVVVLCLCCVCVIMSQSEAPASEEIQLKRILQLNSAKSIFLFSSTSWYDEGAPGPRHGPQSAHFHSY